MIYLSEDIFEFNIQNNQKKLLVSDHSFREDFPQDI